MKGRYAMRPRVAGAGFWRFSKEPADVAAWGCDDEQIVETVWRETDGDADLRRRRDSRRVASRLTSRV